MRGVVSFIGLVVGCLMLCAHPTVSQQPPVAVDIVGDSVTDCDTVVESQGRHIHLVKLDGEVRHAGLDLFTDEVRESIGREFSNRVESCLLDMSLCGMAGSDFGKIETGDVDCLRHITPQTSFTITNRDGREMVIEWASECGPVRVAFPITYQASREMTRAEIEDEFIAAVKSFTGKRRQRQPFDLDEAVPYSEDKYILPGSCYLNKDISQNIYLTSDSLSTLVWDVDFPAESIANLFLCHDQRYEDVELELTVLKHEIGAKEQFTVPLDRFLAYCESQGCSAFWGVEKLVDGKLEGALFLLNRNLGYDHVLKIDCDVVDVISGRGSIVARASLFVPTNNVDNIFQPYVKKTEKERIRYAK